MPLASRLALVTNEETNETMTYLPFSSSAWSCLAGRPRSSHSGSPGSQV